MRKISSATRQRPTGPKLSVSSEFVSNEQRVPFGQTTAGIIVIQGVVTAIVSAVATWVINNARELPWLSILSIFAGIAVGLFLLSTFIFRRARTVLWGWVPVAWRWLRGLRVTTERQREKLRLQAEQQASELIVTAKSINNEELTRALVEKKQLSEALERALSEGAKDSLARHEAELELADKDRMIASLQDSLRKASISDSRSPKLPLPRPRWSVYPDARDDADFNSYMLKNAVPRSVAQEVRIEGDSDFKITSAGHWEDLSGQRVGEFRGTITFGGTQHGVQFRVQWYDEHGVLNTEHVFMGPRTPF